MSKRIDPRTPHAANRIANVLMKNAERLFHIYVMAGPEALESCLMAVDIQNLAGFVMDVKQGLTEGMYGADKNVWLDNAKRRKLVAVVNQVWTARQSEMPVVEGGTLILSRMTHAAMLDVIARFTTKG
jgi:hypothetical protein